MFQVQNYTIRLLVWVIPAASGGACCDLLIEDAASPAGRDGKAGRDASRDSAHARPSRIFAVNFGVTM